MNSFPDLGLAAPILKALAGEGYEAPTPIQAQSIPHILAGRDLLGLAQTGTGKTAAFALPILQRLAGDRRKIARHTCRALVLSPTRELASQIAESFRTYGRHLGLSTAVVFGGVPARPQARALAAGLEILVATPGRLLDHVRDGAIRLDAVEIFVLDEADRMLDMGFIHDVRRLVRALPTKRQSLFFSATMPKEVAPLASELLREPVRVAVAPAAATVERVDQRVIFVETAQKRALLAEILRGDGMGRTLVFTRTRRGADRVARHRAGAGLAAAAIHGDKSQGQRERALAGFRAGTTPILVATDIAARGIDVDGITHVINFDLPNLPESYVHRIGRTARAGAAGTAISFCEAAERPWLADIEAAIRRRIPASDRRASVAVAEPAAAASRAPGRPQPSQPPRMPEGRRGAGTAATPAGGASDLSRLAFLRPVSPASRPGDVPLRRALGR